MNESWLKSVLKAIENIWTDLWFERLTNSSRLGLERSANCCISLSGLIYYEWKSISTVNSDGFVNFQIGIEIFASSESELFRLHRCWWEMLETVCVGDKFEMLVEMLDFYFENIYSIVPNMIVGVFC